MERVRVGAPTEDSWFAASHSSERMTDFGTAFGSQLVADLDIDTPAVQNEMKGFGWTRIGEVALLRFDSSACRLNYRAEAFRDFYLLKVQKGGHATIKLDGRSIAIGPGDVVLCDGAAPHCYEFDDGNEHICVILSKKALVSRARRRSPSVDDFINHRVPADHSAAALMRGYAIGLFEQSETADDMHLAARVLGDAIISCYSAELEASQRGEDPWDCVERFVSSNLEEPALRPGYICHHLNLTPRSLQNLFREKGTSCHRFIANARLEEVCRRLSNPEMDDSITDIAYDVGFDDLSYFSRSFRRKYGQSARDYRRVALAKPLDKFDS